MTAALRLLAAVLILALGHVLAPYAVVLIAVEVTAFAVGLVGLGWLLAATRHTWGAPRRLRIGGAR